MSRLEFTAQAVPGPGNPLLDENISSVKFRPCVNLPGSAFLRIKEMFSAALALWLHSLAVTSSYQTQWNLLLVVSFPSFLVFGLLENNTIILNGFLISQSHGTVGFIVGIQEDIYSSLLLRRQMWESW